MAKRQMPSVADDFAKVWLVAMLFAGVVTAFATWQTDSSWMTYAFAMLFVGSGAWGMFFVIGMLMPWIER